MVKFWNKKAAGEEEKPLLATAPTPDGYKPLSSRTPLLAAILFSIVAVIYIVLPSLDLTPSSIIHTFASSNRCTSISLPAFPGFQITSVKGQEIHHYSSPDLGIPDLNFCNVTVGLTHDGVSDSVFVSLWLPLKGWNGRFMATGGGGLAAGYESLTAYVTNASYAGAFTDAGLTLGGTIDPGSGRWALKSDGTLNMDLVKNFADRSIHDMTVISKAAVEAFYGRKPRYNYYFGCSTGGRMGYFAAQRHPEDFDGILANAPAFYMPPAIIGLFWPSVVMGNIVAPPQCVFEEYQKDIIMVCDPLDGVKDGFISDLEKCIYDTKRLIGSKVTCPDGKLTITAQHAEVVQKVLDGPELVKGEKIPAGNPPGASFAGLANTITINGTIVPDPFFAAENWIKYFVAQDPDYDTKHMTYSQFAKIFTESVRDFDDILGTNDPDLSEFKARGGKLLTWHGLADQLINPVGSIVYRQALEKKMGGAEAVDEFQRLFLAPGVAHCSGGIGPVPDITASLNVLRKWVELDIAPGTLAASTKADGTLVTRDLCRYPRLLKYDGKGDVNLASSFTCE
jgi:feruloyl esterase